MTETTKEALTRTLDGVVTSNKMDKTVLSSIHLYISSIILLMS